MSFQNSCFKNLLFFGFATSCLLQAQEAPQFLVSEEDISDLSVSHLKDRFSLGINLYSVVPSSRPFQASTGTQVQDFRYQVSGALGLDFSYKMTKQFELGVASAFELFESRLQVGGNNSKEFRTAKLRVIPMQLLARYQWHKNIWAPLVEAGAGMGFWKMSLESTNLAQAPIEDSASNVLAHLAGGATFAWLDDTDIGVLLGYRMMFAGQKDFDAATLTIKRKSLTGIFAKATVRYHF